jgi:hypothetical protein
MYQFPNSTAINSISKIENARVSVTWNSGKTYTYELANPKKFFLDLDSTVTSKGSIGQFINFQIQDNVMRQV